MNKRIINILKEKKREGELTEIKRRIIEKYDKNIDNISGEILCNNLNILGNKYDLLEYEETEKRKWMGKVI